jgi:hypothetical protein
MTPGIRPTALLLALVGVFGSALGGHYPTSSQVKAEISRLEQSRKQNPISDKNFVELFSNVGETLKAASYALDARHLYLSLEKLGQAEDLLQGARRGADRALVGKGGLNAYQAEWGKVSVRLTALDKDAHAKDWGRTPLAIRALAETSQGRAIPLLEGGLGFATATGPAEGLLYLGEAEGEADFALFCAALNAPGARTPAFGLRSFLPELQKLQEKTNAAFQPPKSIELHPRFIALNSAIKLAEELDASRFYAGALYQYLEATRHYGMLGARPLDADQKARLLRQLPIEWKKLDSSANDDSIAQLFVERAESYVTHADGSPSSEDEWRGAQVIVDQVLPAYYAAQKPAAAIERASGKTVNVTLVRWPYT